MLINWPIGNDLERQLAIDKLPGLWINSNPYLNYYEISKGVWNYHDGVDLNLNRPSHNLDFGHELRAIADGRILFMGKGGGSWGLIVTILHRLPDDSFIVCRYGHVSWLEDPYRQPQINDYVVMGQPVCKIGNIYDAYGKIYAHLHWNMSRPNDTIMIDKPNHWCGANKQCVIDHYIDPIKFIVDMKQSGVPIPEFPQIPEDETPVTTQEMLTNTPNSVLRFREQPNSTAEIIKRLAHNTRVTAYDLIDNTYRFVKVEGVYGFLANEYLIPYT
jgi:hypothetical protein